MLVDVLSPGLDVVFVGTAAGSKSAELGVYYAGPGNLFWRTLAEIRLTPVQLSPTECRAVTQHGIGLTDLAKHVSGADATLRRKDFSAAGLRAKLLDFRPRVVAFTSKRAGREFYGRAVDYGRQAETLDGIEVFVLASPSGLARSHWNAARSWHELADFMTTLTPSTPS